MFDFRNGTEYIYNIYNYIIFLKGKPDIFIIYLLNISLLLNIYKYLQTMNLIIILNIIIYLINFILYIFLSSLLYF